jgi:hypothetical protein
MQDGRSDLTELRGNDGGMTGNKQPECITKPRSVALRSKGKAIQIKTNTCALTSPAGVTQA